MSAIRLATALVLVSATAVLAAAARQPVAVGTAAFDVPYTIESWTGADAGGLDPETERAIAADLILNRTYVSPDEGALGFYLAYYAQQRPGVSIHSPLHCLPGTGWDILSDSTLDVALSEGARGRVRRIVAQKAASRVLILYWYDIRGRMIASDVSSRLRLVADRLRLGRNDGALVRVVAPVTRSEREAERRAVGFVRALVPHL
jgi:EpsI family protein